MVISLKKIREKYKYQQDSTHCHRYVHPRGMLDIMCYVAKTGNCKYRCTYQIFIVNGCAVLSIVCVTFRIEELIFFVYSNHAVGRRHIIGKNIGNNVSDLYLIGIYLFDVDKRAHRVFRLHRPG